MSHKVTTTWKGNLQFESIVNKLESEGIENFEQIDKFIRRMKSHGCKIAIDDFGTGYSNFEYLIRLDIDFIKIDGSIIKNIVYDKNMHLIVKTIVDFAKKMEYKIIGEYVASKEIHDAIIDLEIDYAQGYYIAQPQEDIIS